MSDFKQPSTTAPAPDEPERRTDGLVVDRFPFPGSFVATGLTVADVDAIIESCIKRRAADGFTFGRCLWLTEDLGFFMQTEIDE